MKVTIFSTKGFEREFLIEATQGICQLQFEEAGLSLTTAHLARGSEAISIFTNDDASAPVLDRLWEEGVKYIATRSAGYDNIDLTHAEQLGFRVANVPEYSPYAIAEHTIAMILALNRKLIQADRKVRDYDFRLDDLIGFDLHGKIVGIIGLGRIGGIVARILHGFGCHIIGNDPAINETLRQRFGVRYDSLDSLCKESDIIILNAPLNEKTFHLIDRKRIKQMKPGVMLINTGRGALLHTEDAIEALKNGQIGYLGLDVYEREKGLFFYDHSRTIPQDDSFTRLLSFKNVLVTGHQAFLTQTALENIADTTAYTFNCWKLQQPSKYELFELEILASISPVAE